jgi:hypothetical protein
MVWVKLDDGFLTNPKVMRAGLEGRALYIAGLCYCAAGLTDGFVPLESIDKIAVLADVRKTVVAVRTLLDIGLWERAPGGYAVHDYLRYQPSADDVRKERQRVAEWRAARKNGVQNGVPGDVLESSSAHVPNGVSNGVRNGVRGSVLHDVRNTTPARPVPVVTSIDVPTKNDPPNPPRGAGERRRKSRSNVDPDQDIGFEFPTGRQP